jgi:hypothetical protein
VVSAGVVQVYEIETGELCVFVCGHCGQPVAGPTEICNNAMHVGADRSGQAPAVRSTAMAVAARVAGARS